MEKNKHISKSVTVTSNNHDKIVALKNDMQLSYSGALNYLLNRLELVE
ncbi:hypothetical protein [Pareuzebyella sediminis]|nr:hypothetical protein [Pareuzebyella sediminis]